MFGREYFETGEHREVSVKTATATVSEIKLKIHLSQGKGVLGQNFTH